MLLPCKLGRLIEFSSLSVVKDGEEVESQVGVEPEPQVDSALKPVDESLLDQLVSVRNQTLKNSKTFYVS